MADQDPPTRRDRDPHFLSRPDPIEAGPATIRVTQTVTERPRLLVVAGPNGAGKSIPP